MDYGLKENLENKQRIISAENLEKNILSNLNIYHLNQNSNLLEKIFSKKADISDNKWELYDVVIFVSKNGVSEQIKKRLLFFKF